MGQQIGLNFIPPATPPPAEPWPHDIHPQITASHNWHYTFISVGVISCCCNTRDVLADTKRQIRSFSEFNDSQSFAKITVSTSGGSAGFKPNSEIDRVGSFVSGMSSSAGVTLNGGGLGYDQEAVTNSWHPLIGKRRWGANGVDFGMCTAILIHTEAYETMNNGGNLPGVGRMFRNDAKKMWSEYLNKLADNILKDCPGIKFPLPIKEIDPSASPKTPLPW